MISVIIPTLNEVHHLKETIQQMLSAASFPDQLEIIVVDAGSTDNTLISVEGMGVKKFSKPEFIFKKFASLNFGTDESQGDIILFLDADTFLPSDFDTHINNALSDSSVVGGAFEFSFDHPDWKLKILSAINRFRYRFGNVYYGDQAVFVRKDCLEKIGGVPEEPLMETAFLCRTLRKAGKLTLIKPGIITSPRRFLEYGFFKVAWFDLNMFIRFNLGLSVSGFAEKYWSKNLSK